MHHGLLKSALLQAVSRKIRPCQAGARCLKAKRSGAQISAWESWPPHDPAVPQRRFASGIFTKAAPGLSRNPEQIQIHPSRSASSQALELTPTLCQGEA